MNIQKFKQKITGKLHGTTLAKVSDVNGKIAEAAGNLILRIDPPTTIQSARIENAIFDHIYNYTAPTGLKGQSSIIDIRPIGERSENDDIEGRHTREFDIKKGKDTFTVETINGVQTLRLSKDLTPRTLLHRMDSLTLEGSITGSGDVSNLAIETVDHISGNGAVKFDLDGVTGQGVINIDLLSAVDLTDLLDVGALFHWLKFPDADDLTSIEFRWGSDSSNYWSVTITSPHDRTSFEDNAYTLQRADWANATKTGSPTVSAIDFLQLRLNYTVGQAQTGVKLDNITAALGEAWEVLFYTDRLFKDTNGNLLETPDDDTNEIMLNADGINILLYEVMGIIAQEVKGKNQSSDLAFYERKLEGDAKKPGMYEKFSMKYPSQAVRIQEDYYEFDDIGVFS